jgi:hypothetical protein
MTDSRRHAAKLARDLAGPDACDDLVAREAAIIEAELSTRQAKMEDRAQPDQPESPLAGLAPEQVARVVIGRALALLAQEHVPDAVTAAELIRVALAALAVRLGDPALLPVWLEALAAEMRNDPTPPNFSAPTMN